MSAFSHKLDQVTYPRLERLDLTQGQLGSFKFTPTDEVRHVFSAASPQFVQQSTHAPSQDIRRVNAPYGVFNTAPDKEYLAHAQRPSANSPTRPDPTFFDKFIKPDLAKSRLLLGPPTLRAAVDGAPTSPLRNYRLSKDSGQCNPLDTIQPNMSAQKADDFHHTPSNDPFPTFTPSAQDDVKLLHTSLIRALAAEQEAHQGTKRLLELARTQKLQAETETQKYLEHNRSLIGSVNMLKSIVQHGMKKEEEAVQKAEYERCYKKATEVAPTILHDAVKNLGRSPESRAIAPSTQLADTKENASRPIPASERSGSMLPLANASWQERYKRLIGADQAAKSDVPVASDPSPSDDSHLFNFDLIESWGSPALRSHFSTSATRRERSDETQKSGDTMDTTTLTEDDFIVCKPPKTMMMPFDPHVQWKQDPIFDDVADKVRRLGHQPSVFLKYPVRYAPNKSDKNLYRTVMIDFIPEGTTSKDVLGALRGGAIELLQLFGPIGTATSFMTARVVFSYEQGAQNVYKRGQTPGIEIRGKRVRVWQVLEATYPRTKEMEKKIFEDGYTRILLIDNAVQTSLEKLSQKLARQIESGFVVEIGKAYDGLPMIEFTSIGECTKALDQLMNDRDFGGSRFDFEDDPCGAPYQA